MCYVTTEGRPRDRIRVETAMVSDPEDSVSRLGCTAIGLADPNVTVSMDRSDRVQMGMNPPPGRLNFPELVHVCFCSRLS